MVTSALSTLLFLYLRLYVLQYWVKPEARQVLGKRCAMELTGPRHFIYLFIYIGTRD